MAVTPLTIYGVSFVSSVLATAEKALANVTSGSTTTTNDSALGTASGYGEVVPAGTASPWQALGAIPALPSNRGFLLDDTLLSQKFFAAGTWIDNWRSRIYGGTGNAVGDMYTRVGVRNATTGTVRWIGTIAKLAQTIANANAQSFAVSGSLPAFVVMAGENIYYERWINITTPVTGASNVRILLSNVATQGNDYCSLVTTGYDTTPTYTRAVTGVSAAVKATLTRAVTSVSAAVSVTHTRAVTGISAVVSVPVPGGLSAYIGMTYLPILYGSLKFDKKLGDRAGCSFSIADSNNTYMLEENTIVVLSDGDVPETLYTGFIDSVNDEKLGGLATTVIKTITLKDGRYLCDKRLYTGNEFLGYSTGEIIAALHQGYLQAEGINAAYALRRDNDATSLGQGVLTNLDATTGMLQLSPSGTPFSVNLTTQSQWTTGATFTNTQAVSGVLSLSPVAAIKMTGKTKPGLTADLICCYTIWSGNVTCAANDYFEYDIWVDPANPDQNGGVDIIATDGSIHRYTDPPDQMGVDGDPKTDISTYASGQWYHRHIKLDTTFTTKHIGLCVVALDGDKFGSYTIYVKNIKYFSSTGTLKATFFDTTLLANKEQKNAGYSGVKVNLVSCVSGPGTYLSKSFTNNVCPLALDSSVSWTDSTPQQASSSSDTEPIVVEISYDSGASWVQATNHAPLATIIPGANITNSHWLVRVTFTPTSLLPEFAPAIDNLLVQVRPATNASVNVFSDIDNAANGDFATGTLSGVVSDTTGLHIACINTLDDWNIGDMSGLTLVGSGSPLLKAWYGGINISVNPSGYATAFYITAGTITNFILEVDVQLPESGGNCGVVYRTTYLGAGDGSNCGAYSVKLSTTSLEFGRGSNSSTSSWTSLQLVAGTYQAGQWYRLTVVANGNTHTMSVDGVQLISMSDATFPSGGNIGVRWSNHAGTVRESGVFDNLGIMKAVSALPVTGTRTHPALSLSGSAGASVIFWNAVLYSNTTLLIEASLDGGSTWKACVNGGAIPGITPGMSLAGKSLLIKETLSASNTSVVPLVTGMHVVVYGAFNATGSRISPALVCDNAGTLGDTVVTWATGNDTLSAIAVDAGTDGSTWTAIHSGDSVPGLTVDGTLTTDDFDSNTSANYTKNFWSGGATPTAVFDTANKKLTLSLGVNSVYSWTAFTTISNGCVEITTDQVQNGGLVFRMTDINNCYYLVIHDASASSSPQKAILRKRVAGVDTIIGIATNLPDVFFDQSNTAFVRGTPHIVKIIFVGNNLTTYFDGQIIHQITDSSFTSGNVGIFQDSATVASQWYNLRAQAYGDSAVGKTIYTRVRFTVTDPTYNPVLLEIVATALSPDIEKGNVIYQTQYNNKYIGESIADATSQSLLEWRIDENLHLLAKNRVAAQAPFVIATANKNFIQATAPKINRNSPLYRNRQYVTGAISIQTIQEDKTGDFLGSATSWVLKYPVLAITEIKLNNQKQSFGIQDKDTGKYFYYTVGQNSFSLDTTQPPPLATDTIHITYLGITPYTAMKESTAQQALLAALSHSSGIVEMTESCEQLPSTAADTLAQSRIDAFGDANIDWSFATHDKGLEPGQIVTVMVPEHDLNNLLFLITGVSISVEQLASGALLYTYDVAATTGPNVGNWRKNLKTALLRTVFS